MIGGQQTIVRMQGAVVSRAGARRLALRQRAAEHPMAMFSLLAAMAMASVLLVPRAEAIPSQAEIAAPAIEAGAAPKSDRLTPRSAAELVCAGQAWGAETPECLVAINREGGKIGSVRIRPISGA